MSHRPLTNTSSLKIAAAYCTVYTTYNSNIYIFELFRAYVDLPASLPHKYDVIVDDGRARVPCAQSALRYHGLINYIETKAKSRHLKELPCVKGLCGRCLSETGDAISHVGIFDPAL
jgi:hypothetical protein